MRKTAVILAALWLQALASPALATEYTLTIPVQLKSLSPVVTHYSVDCSLWRPKAGGGNEVVASNGTGMQPVTGGTSGNQKVKFKYEGPAAGAPTFYTCALALCSSGAIKDCGWSIDGKDMDAATFPGWRVSKPGAAFVGRLEQQLPK